MVIASTRQNILHAAFVEFYQNGFQGGSLNHIIETAGTTKGALFHHFSGKQDLGYAVVDEVIQPLLKDRWLDPISASTSPVEDLKKAFRRFVKTDIASGHYVQGCPLNNLAQEMSPLDEGFHKRIDTLYTEWRKAFADALTNGIKNGMVKKTVSPKHSAALLVGAQMGIWGTGKSSRDHQVMTQMTEAICQYLDTLKA